MHRANPKKRRAFILRVTAYAVTLTFSVLTTILLLYVALGYRIDRQSGQVVRNGLLLVDSRPAQAQIFINDMLRDNAAPGRFVLPADSYALRLESEGYRTWRKTVDVSPSNVRNVRYPLLIPTEIQSEQLGTLSARDVLTHSRDRKILILHTPGQPSATVLTLDPEAIKQESLRLPDAFTRENGRIGSLRVIEWALDNKHLLVEHTLPGGAAQTISIDITKPDAAVDVSALYGDAMPADIHYAASNVRSIYGVKDGVLSTYSLTDEKKVAPLLKNIRSYQPYGDDTIIFERTKKVGSEIGIMERSEVLVVAEFAELSASPALLSYASYDNHSYLAVASPDSSVVTIYRDPLKNPKTIEPTPFISLKFANPQRLTFNDSAQFLLVQNGGNVMTYDFEEFKRYIFAADFKLEESSTFTWLDSEHLLVNREDNTTMIMGYDGTNVEELLKVKAGTRLYFSNDMQYAYQITSSDEGDLTVHSASMIVQD